MKKYGEPLLVSHHNFATCEWTNSHTKRHNRKHNPAVIAREALVSKITLVGRVSSQKLIFAQLSTLLRVLLSQQLLFQTIQIRISTTLFTKSIKMAAPNPNDVANAFTAHYYQVFDTNPDALAGLFVSLQWHCSVGDRVPLLLMLLLR